MNILYAVVTWAFLFVLRASLIILGLVVVPVALLFRTTEDVVDPSNLTYPERKVVHLPKWAWLWDNDAEGAMSWMVRWPDLCWDKDPTSFLSMFQWMAIRNPVNNMRFTRGIAAYLPYIKSIDLLYGDSFVSTKYQEGVQFVVGKGNFFRYYSFYYVKVIGDKTFSIRLGHKMEPRHLPIKLETPERKYWKGMTFRVSYKSGRLN
jgi:hypothetical protein